MDFVHTFWHADCVRKNSLDAFNERYRKWCKRHGYFFKQCNAVEVYELSKSVITLVPKDPVAKVLVQREASSPAFPVLSRPTAPR